MEKLYLAWTTVESREEAERLARSAVNKKRAACVQIDGPVYSVFRWEGRVETASEWRLLFKFPESQLASLEGWILANHPYDTPEWVVVEAARVNPEYLKWTQSS